MSIAMNAAPFDNDNDNDNMNNINNNKNDGMNNSNYKNNNVIAKRRHSNKTQKRYPKDQSDKVNSILQTIHNLPYEEEDNSGLGNFTPLSPPISAGVENTKIKENFTSEKQVSEYSSEDDYTSQYATNNHSDAMGPVEHDNETYKRFRPKYEEMYKNTSETGSYNNHSSTQGQGQGQGYIMNTGTNDNELLQKLNYMINLIEQQQDEKTNHVTEEVVLYCFLGIFIIFLVDSFVRVGKYVR